ncbi:hypothetical protein [Micromonospora craniellae]|uniref:Uncharacterized protein n=1 Tax=Micromonospora craniellae TaxID=2294034 RepID=A0A372G2S0_9ACTN|nr:hypothetical protein [Micromonospora craniellae]QOC89875.1 hypothetical protein ID554_16695 [Micromonospora craniellae]RFS47020.1 hypothetical protein D0Q02_07610 [Micromonospora craniellae]
MVAHKMIVIDGVRWRADEARAQGLVDAAGLPNGKAKTARKQPQRHTGHVNGPDGGGPVQGDGEQGSGDPGQSAGGQSGRARGTSRAKGKAATGEQGDSAGTGDGDGGQGDGAS